MTYPVKAVLIGKQRFSISGISEADPYFRSIRDRFDPEFEQFCEDFLRPRDICADLGANLGIKALLLAQHATAGKILAVEPAPTVAPLLRVNVARSGYENITVLEAAVGEVDGTTAFNDNSAFGHISDSGSSVRMVTLESAMREAKLDRLDLIKIDVEGYEFHILRSSWDILSRYRPVIFFEFNSWCQTAFSRTSPLDFIEWICCKFPHIYMVRRVPGQPYLKKITRNDAERFLHTNMLNDRMVTDLVVAFDAERVPMRALTAKLPTRGWANSGLRALNSLLRPTGLELRRIE